MFIVSGWDGSTIRCNRPCPVLTTFSSFRKKILEYLSGKGSVTSTCSKIALIRSSFLIAQSLYLNFWRECLKLIPHKKFSFAKIWLVAAQFEIGQLNLNGARKILGNATGKAPKDKIFKKYIEIELQLCNFNRCRKLYKKYLEWSLENCYA